MGLEMVMLGAPGAGKGTQAIRVASAYKIPHISTGQILRDHIDRGTDLGVQATPYLKRGSLVPDEMACAIVRERILQPDCETGFVLDGFPRSEAQARALATMVVELGKELDLVINLAVPDDEIVERLNARWSCPRCGAIYNLKFNPPRRPGYCDVEGAENVVLTQRPDDQRDTVLNRLQVYHQTAAPVLEFYRKAGFLQVVNGAGKSSDEVFEKIEEILAAKGAA